MSKNVRCSECIHQMTGWDGGFFGLPLTCECRIYGVTEGRKGCSKFKKRITKSDLLNKIQSLEKENEQLRQKIKHCVYVDVDNAKGCMNCKYDEGSICSILNCGTHDYLEGVSECGLKYWGGKDE